MAGIGLLLFSFVQLQRSVLGPFLPGGERSVAELIYSFRTRSRGPRLVAIGGGTGMSTLLRGLKEYTANLAAIVTVADDGGSSGRLREEYRILPPGDFRQCLVALADAEPLVKDLFNHRFHQGSLDGHSFGNLFIMAMAEVTGSFERALRESLGGCRIVDRDVRRTGSVVTRARDRRARASGAQAEGRRPA